MFWVSAQLEQVRLWPTSSHFSFLNAKKAQQLLILAPNSELAGQIFDVTKQWAEPLGLLLNSSFLALAKNARLNV